MARDNTLRDPRVEPIDARRSASDAYLHRAARLAVLLALPALTQAHAQQQIRVPRRSGAAIERSLPRQASARRNLIWRASIPKGVSPPVVVGGAVFVTGQQEGRLALLCLDAVSGMERWRRLPGRSSPENGRPVPESAATAPVSDGKSVFVHFPDAGLLAYSLDGDELWRASLGPLRDVQETSSSPVCADGRVEVVRGRTIHAFDAETGRPLHVAAGDDLDAISAAGPAEAILAPPAISSGRLYVRAQEAIYCFGEEG